MNSRRRAPLIALVGRPLDVARVARRLAAPASERGWLVVPDDERTDGGSDEPDLTILLTGTEPRSGLSLTLYDRATAPPPGEAALALESSDGMLAAAVEAALAGLFVTDQHPPAGAHGTRWTEYDTPDLTPAEGAVLESLLNGHSNREIGEDLGVSVNTVKFHLAAIYAAYDVHSRAELLARFAPRAIRL